MQTPQDKNKQAMSITAVSEIMRLKGDISETMSLAGASGVIRRQVHEEANERRMEEEAELVRRYDSDKFATGAKNLENKKAVTEYMHAPRFGWMQRPYR